MLLLFYQNQHIGYVSFNPKHRTGSLSYLCNWNLYGTPLSRSLSGQSYTNSTTVFNFFSNLLPESAALDSLAYIANLSKHDPTILENVGFLLAGGFSIRTTDNFNQNKTLIPLKQDEISRRFKQKNNTPLLIWHGCPLVGIAGVQDKICVSLDEQRNLFIPIGQQSTHILKFTPEGHPTLLLNEFVCMKLAKQCGFDCPNVSLERLDHSWILLIERFDTEVHTIDGCQLLDLPPQSKYERPYGDSRDVNHIRSGASLKSLFDTLDPKLHASLVEWVVFNLAINNTDAHAKNISFYLNKDELSPSPLYDLIATPDTSQTLAMAIGDEFIPGRISAFDLFECFNLSPIDINTLIAHADSVLSKIVKAVVNSASSVTQLQNKRASQDEIHFVSSILGFIASNATTLRAKITDIEPEAYV